MMTDRAPSPKRSEHVLLKLFVTGRTPNALRARNAVESLVSNRATSEVKLEIVDVLSDPDAASADNVFATPTLIKRGDGPERRLVGDLSSVEKLEIGLLITAPAA